MRMVVSGAGLILAALILACEDVAVLDPFAGNTFELLPSGLDSAQCRAMEGIYSVVDEGSTFGSIAVVKWTGQRCNLFAEKDGIVAAFRCTRSKTSYVLTGRAWWNDSDRMRDMTLLIRDTEGGDSIALGLAPTRVLIRDAADERVRFTLKRPLTAPPSFLIIAHRGGFNNSARFSVPDNSLEMIRSAECFGANAIEIDVRVTKDGVPIIFHDDNFTSRLVNGEYLYGPVSGFTFAHIRAFGTLKNGEPVPTLREALDAVLSSTSIRFVEFDIKSPQTLAALFDIQREYHEKARALGRTLTCYLDLTSEEIANAYIRDTRHETAPSMCELDETWVVKTGARIWSPRWTLGTLTARARAIKSRGVMYVPWTVNEPQFIDALLAEGQADGVLTDVPNIVAFKWYSQ